MKNTLLYSFIKKNPELFWDSKKDAIEKDYFVDRVIQYGNIGQLKECVDLIGKEEFTTIVKKQLSKKTIEYQPSMINFLNIIFQLYDSVSLGNIIERAKGNKRIYR